MYYHSTRNSKLKKTFDEIIIEGLSSDGGLFMPRSWPKVKIENLLNRDDLSYDILAKEIIQNYVGDTINNKELELITKKSYSNFSHEKIAPIKKIEENKFILELFYGPTFAFKDYPLQLVGNLFQYYLTKKNKNITVIGATSGDTGSAAIEACRDKENIKIFILHPSMKTSDIQRKQMTTVMSENVYNIAVEGTFDDCQKIVKDLFVSNKLKNETTLSAINSINWARIISQTVYFFWAYIQAKKFDKKVNYIVPTGNFGNVYAAHVAGIMGLPINKLYVTTNENDIMHRTLSDGDMSLKNVKSTISPSMDIQISSNFERQLFESLDSNSNDLNNLMKEFFENKNKQLSNTLLQKLKKIYSSKSINDSETIKIIQYYYRKYNYVSDPHTATSLDILKNINNEDLNISLACAHPAKFPESIEKAIDINIDKPEKLSDILSKKEKCTLMKNDFNTIQDYILENI